MDSDLHLDVLAMMDDHLAILISLRAAVARGLDTARLQARTNELLLARAETAERQLATVMEALHQAVEWHSGQPACDLAAELLAETDHAPERSDGVPSADT